jgi:glycosyltransferase involved in cell wall biosynthesis
VSGTIIYVGAFELPSGNAAAQRVRANAQVFVALGYRVVCIGVSAEVHSGYVIQVGSEADGRIEYWNRSTPDSSAAWFRRIVSIDDLEPLIAKHAPELKAVIGYDFPAVALRRLQKLAHRFGAVAIGESTEWYINDSLTSLRGVARNVDNWLRMRVQNKRMDGLIVASGYLKDYYAGRGVPLLDLPTLMPDARPHAPEPRPAREPGPMRLIFLASGIDPAVVGTDRERLKDRLDHVIDVLAIAAARGSDFRLDIFGVEQAAYLQIVPDHAQKVALLGSKIRFHGRRPRADVLVSLEEADFSIFLRKATRATLAGFPTKYGESIHHGTPVITNDAGSLSRYHVEGKTGHFIAYGDAEKAAEQMDVILAQNPISVAKMADFCEQSELFSPARHVNAVDQFLTEVRERQNVLPH